MVLGLRSKSKKNTSVSVEFLIHLQEIKPWPISKSSKSALSPSVILQWERGDKLSGSTKSVAPSLAGEHNDGYRLVFNEQFRLPVTLHRESETKSSKSRKSSHESSGNFQKKCVVFSLIAAKGQTLARAVLDLADYGTLESAVTTGVPLTTVRKGLTSSSGLTPQLYLGISPCRKSGDGVDWAGRKEASAVAASASFKVGDLPIKKQEAPTDLHDESRESLVAVLMSDAEDEEIAAFTDDEDEDSPGPSTTQRSDLTGDRNAVPSTPCLPGSKVEQDSTSASVEIAEVESIFLPVISSTSLNPQQSLPVRSAASAAASAYASKKSSTYGEENSSQGSSVDLSSEPTSPEPEDFLTPSSLGAQSPALTARAPSLPPFSSPLGPSSKASPARNDLEAIAMECSAYEMRTIKNSASLKGVYGREEPIPLEKESRQNVQTEVILAKIETKDMEEIWQNSSELGKEQCLKEVHDKEDEYVDGTYQAQRLLGGETKLSSPKGGCGDMKTTNSTQETMEVSSSTKYDVLSSKELSPNIRKDAQLHLSQRILSMENGITGKMKEDGGSFEAPKLDFSPGRELNKPKMEDENQINLMHAARMKFATGSEERNEKLEHKAFEENNIKLITAEAKIAAADSKVKALEKRIQDLEGELVDAAAVEVSLYSVVAQHGSSPHKVHSPARRLARLYLHACKNWSPDRRASCARSCVSALVLVTRACGNDVTRLSFWLSNIVVLREMVSQAFEAAPKFSTFPENKAANGENMPQKSVAKTFSPAHERTGNSQAAEKKNVLAFVTDWGEASTFVGALERVEKWIFGRIIESVWWQALTPPMQNTAYLSLGSSPVEGFSEETKPLEEQKAAEGFFGQEMGDNHQRASCIVLWKSAFLDVLQRICPVRAGGHECGCLRWLIKTILEQCLARLDVAMFNAILRDPSEWAPMDPVADPIVDPNVLPIPAGRLTFGGGAELKNAIRTWSTWLAGFTAGHRSFGDDGTAPYHESSDGSPNEGEKGRVLFVLLRGMADLLMLPKDMLMDKSIRREVCPTLSILLIRKILANFVPDEFSPDPVTPSLLAALTAEITMESQMHGELDALSSSPAIVSAPHVLYVPPPSSCVRDIIGDPTTCPRFGRSSSSLLRKGHTSDDELEELELPLSFMMDFMPSRGRAVDAKRAHTNGSGRDAKDPKMEAGFVKRFQLLKEVWHSH